MLKIKIYLARILYLLQCKVAKFGIAVRISKVVDKSRLTQLFKIIRPICTEHELIRIGGTGDGGYLIPDDLEGIIACFSPGVSNIANFEKEILERGIDCYLADYSVDRAPIGNVHFTKKYVSAYTDEMYMSFDEWIGIVEAEIGYSKKEDYILQMDIEGSEYISLLNTSIENLMKFRIVVLEFHSLHLLSDRYFFDLVFTLIKRLTNLFYIVHIHPNNKYNLFRIYDFEIPPLLEVTFIRKDRVKKIKAEHILVPHPLDCQNNETDKNIKLPACWYKS